MSPSWQRGALLCPWPLGPGLCRQRQASASSGAGGGQEAAGDGGPDAHRACPRLLRPLVSGLCWRCGRQQASTRSAWRKSSLQCPVACRGKRLTAPGSTGVRGGQGILPEGPSAGLARWPRALGGVSAYPVEVTCQRGGWSGMGSREDMAASFCEMPWAHPPVGRSSVPPPRAPRSENVRRGHAARPPAAPTVAGAHRTPDLPGPGGL